VAFFINWIRYLCALKRTPPSQLVDGANGHHIWGERYDRALDDVFELHDEIAQRIAAIGSADASHGRCAAGPHDAPREAQPQTERAVWDSTSSFAR